MSSAGDFITKARAPFAVNTSADLSRAIALADAFGSIGTATLMRALRDGRIAFLPMPAETSSTKFKQFARLTKGRPAVALIGDDDGMNRGPAGWSVAARAMAWSRSIIIHASGAEIHHYETAIVAAQLLGRVLIVECGTATAPAWIDMAKAELTRGASALVIRPRSGVHPAPLNRSALH